MISVGITPFANDIYTFAALYQQKVKAHLVYDFSFLDIEQLNERSLKSLGDVNKVSFSTFGNILNDYTLLPVGSCLGMDNGPKIVASKKINLQDLKSLRLGIPGKKTTAYMLYKSLCPQAKLEIIFPYDNLIDALAAGECDAALLIHESRFQLKEFDLREIADLFDLWTNKTSAPLPLGGVVAKRSLGDKLLSKITDDFSRSLAYSRTKPDEAIDLVLEFSNQKSKELAQKNLDIYVTDESYQLSSKGIRAIQSLLDMGSQTGLLPKPISNWLFES